MTLTRATLGTLAKRATKDIEICGNAVRIQRATPLEFSQYQMSLVDKDGKWNASRLDDSLMLLVARMWIDGNGERLFKDSEVRELGSIDLVFYKELQDACQQFAHNTEASATLGESAATTVSDSPAESASNSE